MLRNDQTADCLIQQLNTLRCREDLWAVAADLGQIAEKEPSPAKNTETETPARLSALNQLMVS